MKKIVRLTESDLHRLVENSVRRALTEIGDTQKGQYMLGRVAGRAKANKDKDTYMAAKNHCPEDPAADDKKVADKLFRRHAFKQGMEDQEDYQYYRDRENDDVYYRDAADTMGRAMKRQYKKFK